MRLGCFVDKSSRDMSGHEWSSFSLTVELCWERCTNRGFAYAGLQARSQCFCDNSYGNYGTANNTDCSGECRGNSSQTCGGTWRNEVYGLRGMYYY